MINTINILISQLPKNLKIMQEVVTNKDWERMRSLAHKTKPNMLLIGAKTQKEILQHIERDAKQCTDLDGIPKLVDKIAGCMPQIIEELEKAIVSLDLELNSTES